MLQGLYYKGRQLPGTAARLSSGKLPVLGGQKSAYRYRSV